MFDSVTVDAWQDVWDRICKMAYEGKDICEKIVTSPGIMHIDGQLIRDKSEASHSREYAREPCVNTYFLKLDNVWKQYSQFHAPEMPKVVPEFKLLIVPYSLYQTLGVQQWFRHSFPNCKVYFWAE